MGSSMIDADHMQEASTKAILYAFLANFGIALAKSWGAWFTGSGSMLAGKVIECGRRSMKVIRQ